MKFDFVYLGQTVLKYSVPLEIFVTLNDLYEKRKKELPKANKQLVGKIQDEVSLHYSGKDSEKMHQHNFLPQDILQWFDYIFNHYIAKPCMSFGHNVTYKILDRGLIEQVGPSGIAHLLNSLSNSLVNSL